MEDNQKHLQQKYMEFQAVSEQLQKVQEHLQNTEQKIIEISHVIESIKDFEDTPNDTPVLLPLTNGVFVKARLEDQGKLLVNVGADTVVNMSYKNADDMLVKQKAEIEALREKIMEAMQQLYGRAQQLKAEMEGIQV